MITPEIVQFFHNQHFTIISTIDGKGYPHNSCKGIVEIDKSGRVYLLDLYTAGTYKNLKRNPRISITAVDEHKFIWYCLKGKAKILSKNKVEPQIIEAWRNKIASRVTIRIIKKIHGEKGHLRHPEILLPKPKYIIVIEVDTIIDLTPGHLK